MACRSLHDLRGLEDILYTNLLLVFISLKDIKTGTVSSAKQRVRFVELSLYRLVALEWKKSQSKT